MRKGDQDNLFNQRMAQRVHGMIDEDAAVVEGDNLYSRGKTRLDLGDLLFDFADDLAGIGAVTDDDDTTNRFFAILIQNAAPELGAKLYAGDVAYGDRRAIV